MKRKGETDSFRTTSMAHYRHPDHSDSSSEDDFQEESVPGVPPRGNRMVDSDDDEEIDEHHQQPNHAPDLPNPPRETDQQIGSLCVSMRGLYPGPLNPTREQMESSGQHHQQHPPSVDEQELMARMDTPMVQAVIEIGYPKEVVRRAIEQRLRTTGDHYPGANALLEAVMKLADENKAAKQASSGQPSTRNAELQLLKEENQQLKNRMRCKVCMEREVSVLFMPCGHLACCSDCAEVLRKCPLCRATIRDTVRVFFP